MNPYLAAYLYSVLPTIQGVLLASGSLLFVTLVFYFVICKAEGYEAEVSKKWFVLPVILFVLGVLIPDKDVLQYLLIQM